ncbi:hypothetical protein PGT21_000903 [Puccinia graminis f. sp. tritici]|uniref:Uncharacterized protein n=1 Tax=Puccinia graminis f. sp. tritici TaxID=56615 RepID=A0A5B0S2R5_PUCGR|nr:hypothetical protein PGT21_000903 [Puccinia graminis f. sp. tritici]KAA1105082.1 hypothetical protein PGTUg99_000934 [Puccinia graminis f. sp. tritici]KAA1132240.1 hypothetical protein PGTUg99_004469 [Puccinia graminis f. sp. tritici]
MILYLPPLFTHYGNLLPPPSPQPDNPNFSTIRSTFIPPIVQEPLRILANTLFLHPLSRYSINLLPTLGPLVELTADPPDRSPNPSAQCAETHPVPGFQDNIPHHRRPLHLGD